MGPTGWAATSPPLPPPPWPQSDPSFAGSKTPTKPSPSSPSKPPGSEFLLRSIRPRRRLLWKNLQARNHTVRKGEQPSTPFNNSHSVLTLIQRYRSIGKGEQPSTPFNNNHSGAIGLLLPVPLLMHPLEQKFAAKDIKIQRLMRGNQRLTATNSVLRQELAAAHQKLQEMNTHIGATEQNILCRYYKRLGHHISKCQKRERLHRPFVSRSYAAVSVPAQSFPSAPQSSTTPVSGFSYDQLSQLASLLAQNMGFTEASSISDFTTLSVNSENSTPWIFDSGATHHMIFNHSILTQCSSISDPLYIYTANSKPLAVTHTGNINSTYEPSGLHRQED